MGIFSKAIQKTLTEDENQNSPEKQSSAAKENSNVVFFHGRKNGATDIHSSLNGQKNANDFGTSTNSTIGRKLSEPPEFVRDLENVKIGKPLLAEILDESEKQKSAFDGQSEIKAGTALTSQIQNGSAGATLDAVGLTRLPDFPVMDINPERVEPHIVAITQPRSPFCEEYRGLRTTLIQAQKRKNIKAVVVSSSLPGEGKSVTVLNLAWLLAQTDGVRALVIDSDLRLPSLDDYLGMKAEKGLSDVLDGKVTWQETIIKLNPAGLYPMPGGTPREDVAEQLSGPKFKKILDEARGMFDYILIDAPPLGIFSDAAVLTDYADGAMLVIKAGKARYSKVTRLLEMIPKERMLGVVLNCSEQELEESHYYYYERERIKNKSEG